MALSQNLVDQFVELTKKDNDKLETESDGIYKKIDGIEYVQLDGSEILTPVKSLVEAETGERVKVLIKNHTATVTHNITSPAARSKSVENLKQEVDENGNMIQQLDNTIVQQNNTIIQLDNNINQQNNTITQMNNVINQQDNSITQINNTINQQNNDITQLDNKIVQQGNDITQMNNQINQQGNIINQQGNTINQINNSIDQQNNIIREYGNNITLAQNDIQIAKSDIQILNSGFKIQDGVLTGLSEIIVDELESNTLNTHYANIYFTNIQIAAIEKLFSDSGIIKDIVVQQGKITGELVGVTIKGDLIEANSIVADKLVVLGEDGIYYKLNIDGLDNISTEQSSKFQLMSVRPNDWSTNYKDYYYIDNNVYKHIAGDEAPTWVSNRYYKLTPIHGNGLDGTNIIAQTITADKITVSDLVAFGATIGGFHIDSHSLYSGAKNSVGNTTRGIFLGDDGQLNIGDSNNYMKFYKDQNNNYKLEIQSDSFKIASSGKTIQETIDDSIAKTVKTVDVEYYLSDSSSELIGGSWQTNAPTWVNGKYMWSRQKVTYVDNTTATRNETCIAGAKGETGQSGTSITITSTSITYQASNNGTTAPTGTWSTTIPSLNEGQYLWTRTIVNYSNGTNTEAYSVSYKGTSGSSGKGISSIEYYYKVTTTSTEPAASDITDTTLPTLTSTNKYLWRKEIITYTDSTSQTTISLLAVYGNSGTSATNIICGNEAQVIPCNNDGTVTSQTTITIPFAGYVGSSRKACTVSYSTLPSGITLVSNTGATTSSDGSLILSVAANSNLGGASIITGDITLTFTCNSKKFVKKFTWTKGIKGDQGIQGIQGNPGQNGTNAYTHIRYSANSDGTNFVVTPTSSTIYIGVYNGTSSTAPTDKTAYTWSKYKGDKGDPGQNGGDGNGINSITYYYKVTTTQTAPSASEIIDTTMPTLTSTNKYLWQKQVIDFTDSSIDDKTTVYLIAVYGDQGIQGIQGNPGQNGTNAYTHIRYSANSDGTNFVVTPTSSTIYIGVYNGTSSTAPTDKTAYTWSKYKGDKGDPGLAGNGINSITYYYKASSSSTAPSASEIIDTTIPTLTSTNKYLWQKQVIDFTDQTVDDQTNISLIAMRGDNGSKGDTGNGINSITYTYKVTTTDTPPEPSSTGWNISMPTLTSTNKYLWQKEVVDFTDVGTQDQVTVILLAIYGDTGVGVGTITELYYLSDSSAVTPTKPSAHVTDTSGSAGRWTLKSPVWETNKYYWTCSEIKYSDNTYSWTDPVLADGINTANQMAYEAKDDIDNLNVGGRNLLLNSSFENGKNNWATYDSTTNLFEVIYDIGYDGKAACQLNMTNATIISPRGKLVNFTLVKGDILLASFKIKAIDADSNSDLLHPRIQSYYTFTNRIVKKSLGNDWYLYVYKYEYTGDNDVTIENKIFGFYETTGNFIIDDIKLELGNKPTDWSAAPEDLDEVRNNTVSTALWDDFLENTYADDLNKIKFKIEHLGTCLAQWVGLGDAETLFSQSPTSFDFNFRINNAVNDINTAKTAVTSDSFKNMATKTDAQNAANNAVAPIAALAGLQNYIKFDQDPTLSTAQITIGCKDSKILTKITRNGIYFEQDNSENESYANSDAFNSNDSITRNSLRIGPLNSPGYIWMRHGTNNKALCLIYKSK